MELTPLIKDKLRLSNFLKDIPNDPGCYLMKDREDRLLYVGKSKKLRNRVRSKKRLESLNISNVIILLRDGFFGYSHQAPFDRIIMTAAVEEIPSLVVSQLKIGGIMIVPVGLPNQEQSLLKVVKTEKGLDIKELMRVRFVQMKEGLVNI